MTATDDDSRALHALKLVVQNDKYNCCHDAAVFSRLWCCSRQLQEMLLKTGRVSAVFRQKPRWNVAPHMRSMAEQAYARNWAMWLQKHLHLGTIRSVMVSSGTPQETINDVLLAMAAAAATGGVEERQLDKCMDIDSTAGPSAHVTSAGLEHNSTQVPAPDSASLDESCMSSQDSSCPGPKAQPAAAAAGATAAAGRSNSLGLDALRSLSIFYSSHALQLDDSSRHALTWCLTVLGSLTRLDIAGVALSRSEQQAMTPSLLELQVAEFTPRVTLTHLTRLSRLQVLWQLAEDDTGQYQGLPTSLQQLFLPSITAPLSLGHLTTLTQLTVRLRSTQALLPQALPSSLQQLMINALPGMAALTHLTNLQLLDLNEVPPKGDCMQQVAIMQELLTLRSMSRVKWHFKLPLSILSYDLPSFAAAAREMPELQHPLLIIGLEQGRLASREELEALESLKHLVEVCWKSITVP